MLRLFDCIARAPLRAGTSSSRDAARIFTAFLAVATLLPVLNVPTRGEAQQLYVVGSDRGGYLHDRLAELDNLARNGIQVEIRGRVCYSTCTMFLGLPGTCVEPDTTFGFHGPSRSGRRLAPEDFDYFSKVMADYYPEPLKTWFMTTARNRINGVHKVKGSELIRMGVPACRTA
ncbi:hypothetical protein [Ruegeria arenilitoris]|uniref:hypothetical protein n=1 Tax=Ruegeria arenilitoris TaxID=1173585 RepID=UPI001479E223|nr:hypothetical protein [Ruegeria arenilitoris]